MRMRWNFHRLLLNQSMNFYHNEFAGRVAAKVMQTALAVRDLWFILADILVYVVIYFLTMIFVVGQFNLILMLPFLSWFLLFKFLFIGCYNFFGTNYFVHNFLCSCKNKNDAIV